jgi:hypothetical protein
VHLCILLELTGCSEHEFGDANAGLSEIGTIRIELHAGTVRGRAFSTRAKPIHQVKLPGDQAVSERCKKGGAHVARFVGLACHFNHAITLIMNNL